MKNKLKQSSQLQERSTHGQQSWAKSKQRRSTSPIIRNATKPNYKANMQVNVIRLTRITVTLK